MFSFQNKLIHGHYQKGINPIGVILTHSYIFKEISQVNINLLAIHFVGRLVHGIRFFFFCKWYFWKLVLDVKIH